MIKVLKPGVLNPGIKLNWFYQGVCPHCAAEIECERGDFGPGTMISQDVGAILCPTPNCNRGIWMTMRSTGKITTGGKA